MCLAAGETEDQEAALITTRSSQLRPGMPSNYVFQCCPRTARPSLAQDAPSRCSTNPAELQAGIPGAARTGHSESCSVSETRPSLDGEVPEHSKTVSSLSTQDQNDCSCHHGIFLVTYHQRWPSMPFLCIHTHNTLTTTRLIHTEDTCKIHMCT